MKDINWVNKEIKRMEPNISEESKDFLAYQILISAAITKPKQQPILRFMKTKRWREVVELVEIAEKEKIFVGDKLCGEIYRDSVGLALGVLLVLGFVRRSPVKDAAMRRLNNDKT